MNAAAHTNTVEPIRKELTVNAPAERAFRVFTANIAAWWPKEHHIGKAELKGVYIEPKKGGRWYEEGVDGKQCEWGHVIAFDPPKRLVLAWQLNMKFEYDPKLITEVEVLFQVESPTRTRVVFEHRNLERFGEGASETRKAMDAGWAGILQGWAKLAESTQ